MSLLEVRDLEVRYGEIVAVHDVELRVEEGEFYALLGPNGAGKSSTLQAIAGLVPTSRGEVTVDGRRVNGRAAHKLAASGIMLIPEGRGIFPTLTVRENLEVVLRGRRNGAVAAGRERVFEYFPILEDRLDQQAGTMSGGEQQMLALARAIISSPRLLMLDEISLGLAPALVERLFETVRRLREEGATIVLVEQYVHEALAMADRVGVLMKGQLVFDGPAAKLEHDEHLMTAYLGEVG